jgi:hypothetical protein
MSTDLTGWPESPCLGRHVAELEAKAIGVDVSRRLAIDCRQMQLGRLDEALADITRPRRETAHEEQTVHEERCLDHGEIARERGTGFGWDGHYVALARGRKFTT